jgi:hypothetical protein
MQVRGSHCAFAKGIGQRNGGVCHPRETLYLSAFGYHISALNAQQCTD